MDGSQWFQRSYTIRRVVAFGVAGSSSVILPFVLLLFASSQISLHPGPDTDTVYEMMGYVEFFLFASGSYFGAAILAWKFREHLQKYLASWLAIAVLGSITFSVLLLSRLVFLSGSTTANDSMPSVWGFFMGVLLVAVVCFFPAFVACGLASALIGSRERKSPILPLLT